MGILVDHQIDQAIAANPPLATGIPHGPGTFTGPRSQVQAASLDLSIGDIFIPGTDADKPGGLRSPHSRVALKEGKIAVIRTRERLAMPSNIIAWGFPPASLSIQGALMTNPGQIDPGYHGFLHLTIINMSSEPLLLCRGDRLIRLIFSALETAPHADYRQRHPNPSNGPITDELLQSLSIDFLSVEQRAEDMIEKSERKTNLRAALISGAVAVFLAFITAFVPRMFDRYYALESSLNALSVKTDAALASKVELTKLEDQVNALDRQLSKIATVPAPSTLRTENISTKP